jgi:hypothetical protein
VTTPGKLHRYFVSYFIAPGGFGNTEISLRLPICGMADVNLIADAISRDKGGAGITVLNFQLLTDEVAR